MVLLQNKLNLRVAQKQILTPGLVQMVSVLALNKLELKDMITAEMVENPVLEELDPSVPLLDEVAGKEEERERSEERQDEIAQVEERDPFEEIDFGTFFRDYLDPGTRTGVQMDEVERPSFENFLSRPTTLTDHLMWQVGSLSMSEPVRELAEIIIGNLNEDGYLRATDEELLEAYDPSPEPTVRGADAADRGSASSASTDTDDINGSLSTEDSDVECSASSPQSLSLTISNNIQAAGASKVPSTVALKLVVKPRKPRPTPEMLQEALQIVQGLDPVGVAARDLRECLLVQLKHHLKLYKAEPDEESAATVQVIQDCLHIVHDHLPELQNKQFREIAKAIGRNQDAVTRAFDYIRTLDPRPGSRYNQTSPRLIEPDVAFVKQGDQWLVLMNEDDLPQLRLSPVYRKWLNKDAAEKDVRNYVKERFKSAIQLIKNIEQRKQTILKVCYSIIERQRDFLEHGIDHLKPMMIKDVAEEIGVHPSTVSRAVANKYAHTPQGVFELRYFFSESVNGPEGGNTSLLILKRRVKKLIEEEDPARPLTDEQITRILQSQGIQVTRRTVAKYREDMRIPSTHQRRVKNK